MKREDRRCEYCTYRNCPPRKSVPEGSGRYVRAMERVLGHRGFLSRSRDSWNVWARNMVAFRMWRDGYRPSDIGRVLGRDHSTVAHCVRKAGEMLAMPGMYPDETEIWEKFNKILENEEDLG